jgi:hypothetical protein
MSSTEHESALQRLPADIHAALAPSQRARLAELMAQPASDHTVAYQVSTSLLGRNFYLALFWGREQRSFHRLDEEGQRRSFKEVLFAATLISTVISGAFTLTVAAVAVGLYLLKSFLGIDIFEHHSFMHRFFFD